ncbi:hypothetical protein ABIE54_005781 [Chitinophagaceae bacterium OAS944]
METIDVVVKLLIAVLIGGIIGAEREYHNKSAGLRTLMLICIGSTLFTIFSMEIGEHTSPDRIASNIVTGIGFVGAGVIFMGGTRHKRRYHCGHHLGNGSTGRWRWGGSPICSTYGLYCVGWHLVYLYQN